MIRTMLYLDTRISRLVNFFYGNGTSADILNSTWKNKEKKGVFQDLGPHIFDMLDFFNITFEVKDIL